MNGYLFVFFEPEGAGTGRIVGSYEGMEAELPLQPRPPGSGIVRTDAGRKVHPDTHFIGRLGGAPVVRDRPVMDVRASKTTITADGNDAAVFAGLPRPVVVVQDIGTPSETTYHVEDGTFEFAAASPGLYSFRFSKWPFRDLDLTVLAT